MIFNDECCDEYYVIDDSLLDHFSDLDLAGLVAVKPKTGLNNALNKMRAMRVAGWEFKTVEFEVSGDADEPIINIVNATKAPKPSIGNIYWIDYKSDTEDTLIVDIFTRTEVETIEILKHLLKMSRHESFDDVGYKLYKNIVDYGHIVIPGAPS